MRTSYILVSFSFTLAVKIIYLQFVIFNYSFHKYIRTNNQLITFIHCEKRGNIQVHILNPSMIVRQYSYYIRASPLCKCTLNWMFYVELRSSITIVFIRTAILLQTLLTKSRCLHIARPPLHTPPSLPSRRPRTVLPLPFYRPLFRFIKVH